MKTQTIFSVLSLLFLFSANSHAQFSFGLKGGYHQAWQHYGDDFGGNGNDLKIKGFSTALTAYYQLGKRFSVGAEPAYIRRGAACEPGFFLNNPYFTGDATLYANYISTPFLLRSDFYVLKNRLNLFGKCGGSTSYLVDGYRELDLEWLPDGSPSVQDINFDGEPDLNRWDAGLNGGIGLGIRLGSGQVQLEYDFYYSLVDMNRQLTSKNRNMGLALGYMIRL